MVGKIEFVATGDGENTLHVDMRDVSLNDKASVLRGILEGLRLTPTEAMILIMAIDEHDNKKKKGDNEEEEEE